MWLFSLKLTKVFINRVIMGFLINSLQLHYEEAANMLLLTGACEDSVTKERYINVNDDEGNTIDQAESCAEIMKKWPSLCEFDLIGGNGGRCCKSCGSESRDYAK